MLSGGGAWPPAGANDGKAWADFINSIQAEALKPDRNPLGIPIIYGADGVHGHNNLSDAIDFPHQNGLGASFDPGLLFRGGARDRKGPCARPAWCGTSRRCSTPSATSAGAAAMSHSGRTRC